MISPIRGAGKIGEKAARNALISTHSRTNSQRTNSGDRRSSERFHRFPETDRAHLSLPSVHREPWWGRSERRVGRPARWLRSLARGLSESTVLTRPQATIDRISRRFDLAANSSRARQPCPYVLKYDLRLLPKTHRHLLFHRAFLDGQLPSDTLLSSPLRVLVNPGIQGYALPRIPSVG